MRTPVSIGVVGDLPSAVEVVEALEHLPQADVRWLCDEGRGKAAGLRRGIRQTMSFAEVLDDELVDAVVVAAPPGARPQLAASALDADKHVYVIGIPALSVAQAEHLRATARRRGRCVMSADLWRFDPVTAKVVELIRRGDLGDVLYLHGESRIAVGGDPLLASAAADELALVLHLLADTPISVAADGDRFLDNAAHDFLEMRLGFATGIVSRSTVSALDPRLGSIHVVVGSQASAVVERSAHGAASLAVHSRDPETAAILPRIPPADPLKASCEAFVSRVRAVEPAVMDAESIAVVDVLEQVSRALRHSNAFAAQRPQPERELRVVGIPAAGAN